VFSNRFLLWGIAFELALGAVLIYVPPCHAMLATAPLGRAELLFALPPPFIVWRRRAAALPDRPAGC